MENSTLLVAAVFIFLLALCMIGLFIHLVRATRSDSMNAINQLKSAILKIQQLENASERTFGEFKHLLEYRLRFMFVQMRTKTQVNATQTDEELGIPEVVRHEVESQTDFVEQTTPPALDIKPVEAEPTIEDRTPSPLDQALESEIDLPVLPPIVAHPAESRIDLSDLPPLECEPEAPREDRQDSAAPLKTPPRASQADLSDLPPLVTRPVESRVDLSDLPPLVAKPTTSQMSLDLSDLTHLVVQPAPSSDLVIPIRDLD